MNPLDRATLDDQTVYWDAARFYERRKKKETFQEIVADFAAYHHVDTRDLAKIWKQFLAAHQVAWKPGQALTGSTIKRIDEVLSQHMKQGGFVTPLAEPPINAVHHFANWLIGRTANLTHQIGYEEFRAVIMQKNPAMLAEFRGQLQEALRLCEGKPVNDRIVQAFIHQILALFPFTYPELGTRFSIPVKQGEVWRLVDYRVDRQFALSPYWLSTPLPAYGLVSETGSPLLAFLGSTYPAGEGFFATWVVGDVAPGTSVGGAPFSYGQAEIGEWLNGKRGVKVVGTSLGGALALHALRSYGEHISEVHVTNPAGLYPWNYDADDAADVHIYYQWNDLVSTMGYFPRHAKIHRVVSPQDENFMSAHARCYAGLEKVTIFSSTIEYEHSRWDRTFLTALHLLVSPIVFTLLLVVYLVASLFSLLYRLVTLPCRGWHLYEPQPPPNPA